MSERTKKTEILFHEASALTPEERERYLHESCSGDADLRREVEELLESIPDGDKMFLRFEQPQCGRGEVCPASPPASVGSMIGRYKLLEKIGEGGMGVVYLAEQELPVRRKVALKIIKLGMDTEQIVARFQAERQALAMMDHPNIARILDVGATDTGRPYFVMELVQGVPITGFCDGNKLSVEERLKLFVPVCRAIQSAHHKGIIHRDIKPSNVLVTMHNGTPHPMVIDFGVAKAIDQKLTEKTMFTNFATMVGTPAYMSPEQAEMNKLDVDTRTDIYSLGVLLYELLTGTTPFSEERLRSVSYGEMQRIITEEQPERPGSRLKKRAIAGSAPAPGTHRSTLATDLDWIVMKCLEKDRNRRYETANGLAADLQRQLDSEPVVARPPGALYRLQKFTRRNKLKVAAASVVLLAVCGGLLVSTWQAVRATRAERDALAVKDFLIEQLLAANPFMETAYDPYRRRQLERVAEAVGKRFADQPLIEAEVRMAVGEAFHGIDEGDNAALEQFQKAYVIRRRELGPTNPDTLYATACAACAHVKLGDAEPGNVNEGEKVLAEALAYVEAKGNPESAGEVEVLSAHACILSAKGRPEEAIPYFDRVIPAAEHLADHKSFRFQMKLLWRIGAFTDARKTNEADALSLAGIRQAQDYFGSSHPVTAAFYRARANFFVRTGRFPDAVNILELNVVPVYRRSFGADHTKTLQEECALALALEWAKEFDRALDAYTNLHQRIEAKVADYGARRALDDMGLFFTKQRRFDLAGEVFDTLCKWYEANPPAGAMDLHSFVQAAAATKGWKGAARIYREYADRFTESVSQSRSRATVLLYTGDSDGYRQVVEKVLVSSSATNARQEQKEILNTALLGEIAFLPEQICKIEALIQSIERTFESETKEQQAGVHRALGGILLRLGRLTNSLEYLEKAGKAFSEGTNRVRVLLLKSMCLHRLNRIDEARASFDEAEAIAQSRLLQQLNESEGFLNMDERTCLILRREARALLGVK